MHHDGAKGVLTTGLSQRARILALASHASLVRWAVVIVRTGAIFLNFCFGNEL